MIDVASLLVWSTWQPLLGCWRGTKIPAQPGLYRIRRAGRQDLDYLGQTGSGTMTLRKRLGMLKGIYGEQMPYRAPHTAGPALWALLHNSGIPFEVAVAVVEGTDAWRKGMEAVAISLYRQDQGRSPTVNFGRMPTGYRASSSNDSRLARMQKLFRGGPCAQTDASHSPGIAPLAPLLGDPHAQDWCGHAWSAWRPVSDHGLPSLAGEGLYRLRSPGQACLLYIGQGKVADRLAAHVRKCQRAGHRQGDIFRAVERVECSWVLGPTWLTHQRLELENDLIAAHSLATGMVPLAQFLGEQTAETLTVATLQLPSAKLVVPGQAEM
jgi:hypothetical protein